MGLIAAGLVMNNHLPLRTSWYIRIAASQSPQRKDWNW